MLEVFTLEETATLLKVTTQDVYKAIERGELRGFQVGDIIRVTGEAIEEFMRTPARSVRPQTNGDHPVVAGSLSQSRTRSGNLEYLYGGAWVSARALLEALERDSHPYVDRHPQPFRTVLHGSGNGLSNLAKHAARTLSLPSREKR